jgi:hypothetical protein
MAGWLAVIAGLVLLLLGLFVVPLKFLFWVGIVLLVPGCIYILVTSSTRRDRL